MNRGQAGNAWNGIRKRTRPRETAEIRSRPVTSWSHLADAQNQVGELVKDGETLLVSGRSTTKCCPDARVTVGPITILGISINADCAAIAVDGIMAKEGLTTNCLEEAVMASQMIAAARRTIVVADSSRFGKRFFARIGPIESMRILITDKATVTGFGSCPTRGSRRDHYCCDSRGCQLA